MSITIHRVILEAMARISISSEKYNTFKINRLMDVNVKFTDQSVILEATQGNYLVRESFPKALFSGIEKEIDIRNINLEKSIKSFLRKNKKVESFEVELDEKNNLLIYDKNSTLENGHLLLTRNWGDYPNTENLVPTYLRENYNAITISFNPHFLKTLCDSMGEKAHINLTFDPSSSMRAMLVEGTSGQAIGTIMPCKSSKAEDSIERFNNPRKVFNDLGDNEEAV